MMTRTKFNLSDKILTIESNRHRSSKNLLLAEHLVAIPKASVGPNDAASALTREFSYTLEELAEGDTTPGTLPVFIPESGAPIPYIATGRLLVQVKPGTVLGDILEVLAQLGLGFVRRLGPAFVFEPIDGIPLHALSRIDNISELGPIARVSPELLTTKVNRSQFADLLQAHSKRSAPG